MKKRLILALVISSFLAGILFVYADWTAPVASPPTCAPGNPGCDVPLNVSAAPQIKHGGLTVGYDGPLTVGFAVLNGNAGIGVAAPTSKLHSVVTNATSPLTAERTGANAVRFNVLVGGNDLGLYQKGNGAADGWTSGADNGIGYKISNNQGFGTNDFLTVLTSGNVGIGDTTPTTKLDVAGAVHSTGDVCTDLAGGRCLSTVGGGGGIGGSGTVNRVAKFDSATTIRDSAITEVGGNVGIGIAAPTRKLELSGTVTGIKVTDTDPAGNAFIELSTNDGGSSYFQNITGRTKIRVGGADRMTFLNNGNVGIGLVNPSQMLEVFGGNIKLGSALGVGAVSKIVLQDENDYMYKEDQLTPGTLERIGFVFNLYEVMTLKNQSTGSGVGIGTRDPSQKLHVIGNILASGSITEGSDARMKDDVQPLTGALSKIDQLRGVSFLWNELSESQGHKKGVKDIGVIAQEVEAVYPELVTTYGEQGYKAVDYSRLTAVLIEAVKELKAENEALKQRVEALERK